MPDRWIHNLVGRSWAAPAVWLILIAGLLATSAPPPPEAIDMAGFLPADAASGEAYRRLAMHFRRDAGLRQAVVVIERADDPATEEPEELTGKDLAALDLIAQRINQEASRLGERDRPNVLSPTRWAILKPVMISAPRRGLGQAALVSVQMPADRPTAGAIETTALVRRIVADADLPPGLNAAVTGSAGYTLDYTDATAASLRRMFIVAIIATLAVLLVAHRAPLAAAIPAVAVAAAVIAADTLWTRADAWGLTAGPIERILLLLLTFAAAMNYCLFYLGRFRLQLATAPDRLTAAIESWRQTAPAMVISALITIAGMFVLSRTRCAFLVNLGLIAAVALFLAAAVALTLVPPVAAALGGAVFRPGRRRRDGKARTSPWLPIAVMLTRRPKLVLIVVGIIIATLAARGSRTPWSYDVLADLGPTTQAVRGAAMIERHWVAGEQAPVSVLIECDRPVDANTFVRVAERLTEELTNLPGVGNVRSAAAPLGRLTPPTTTAAATHPPRSPSLAEDLVRSVGAVAQSTLTLFTQQSYIRPTAMRMEVILTDDPFSEAAADTVRAVGRRTRAAFDAIATGADGRVYIAGLTAETIDIRTQTQRDFWRIAAVALLLTGVLLVLWLRSPLMAAAMVAGTLLGYLAALGLTRWVVVDLLGGDGVDWRIRILLLVLMIAMAGDYTGLVASRLMSERRTGSPRRAVRRAVAATGGIVATSGVILAATVGSLMLGELGVLMQLGLALTGGLLLETLLIRTLLLPVLATWIGRARQAPLAATGNTEQKRKP